MINTNNSRKYGETSVRQLQEMLNKKNNHIQILL